MSSSDSSFSSSFSSSFGASAAAPPPAEGAAAPPEAGAPPPEPTLERRSFTFFPSRALASSVAQIGSSSMLAAFVSVQILSDCESQILVLLEERELTVISIPSSARISAA
jgi:hypothetical protein